MSRDQAMFADHLYEGLDLATNGCGLLGFCGAWMYERHARDCKPGMWRVGVVGHEAGEFWELLTKHADAVMDDFGNLRGVQ